MDRTPLGIAVLVAAALALLIVNRASGRDAQGTAVQAPPLPVPAAGACIEVSAATRTLGTGAHVVPCSTQHTGEVAKAWATRSLRTSSTIPCGVTEVAEFPAAGNWTIPPITVVSFPMSAGGAIGWTACVAEPATTVGDDPGPVEYVGRISEIATVNELPPVLRMCLLELDDAAAGAQGTTYQKFVRVGCSQQHNWEVLAILADPTEQAVPDCREFAEQLVGSAAAFTGPDALLAGALPASSGGVLSGGLSGTGPSVGSWYTVSADSTQDTDTCAVHAASGRTLVGSVAGLGSKPIPYG